MKKAYTKSIGDALQLGVSPAEIKRVRGGEGTVEGDGHSSLIEGARIETPSGRRCASTLRKF